MILVAVTALNLPLDGVRWGQNKPLELAGYQSVILDDSELQAWTGTIHNEPVSIVAKFTPLTHKLWGVFFLHGKACSYLNAVERYKRYRDELISLYGRPAKSYDSIMTPYTLDTAMMLGKFLLADFWPPFSDSLMAMDLTAQGYTRITYESREYRTLAAQEYE